MLSNSQRLRLLGLLDVLWLYDVYPASGMHAAL